MAQKDRRASPRFLVSPGNYATYREGSAAIRDLSLDGVFIKCRDEASQFVNSHPLSAGNNITLELRLHRPAIFFRGIVRHVSRKGMGIQFVHVPSEARRRLEVYLSGRAAPSGEAQKI